MSTNNPTPPATEKPFRELAESMAVNHLPANATRLSLQALAEDIEGALLASAAKHHALGQASRDEEVKALAAASAELYAALESLYNASFRRREDPADAQRLAACVLKRHIGERANDSRR